MNGAGPYFFLSYARDDRENDDRGVIERFCKDVTARLKGITGEQAEGFVYLDTDMESGVSWPHEVAEALRTCRAFVPMLSATYLRRNFCGKEWTAFSQRLEHQAPGAPLIQPVLLFSPDDALTGAPQFVTDIEYSQPAYPKDYLELGLLALPRLREEAKYDTLVYAFAARLKDVVEATPLPPADSIPPIRDVVPAFGPAAIAADARAGTPARVTTKGAKYVHLVAVVADKNEFPAWRGTVDAYSDDGALEWQPFYPEAKDSLADIVNSAAATASLRIGTYDVADDGVEERIRAAVAEGNIVAVVADCWSLLLDAYRDRVRGLDPAAGSHCVIVIPRRPHDPEIDEAREVAVRIAFENRGDRPSPDVFLYPIASLDQMRAVLGPALVKAQGRINSNQQNYRKLTEIVEQLHKPEIQNTSVGAPP